MTACFAASSALLNSRLVRREPTFADFAAEKAATDIAARMPATGRRARANHPPGFGPFGERARQRRVYDRAKSRKRKRMMGGDGRLPNTIRHWFTEGERAVLSVIADEVKRRGRCELMVEKMAARAGVSIRLVQYTLATASWKSGQVKKLPPKDRPPLLITVEYRRKGRKNAPNVIKIVSREWINWLSYQPREAPAVDAAEEGEWTVFDAYAGRLPIMGCRKKHTSEKPIDLDVVEDGEIADLSDGWQRLRRGLPLQGAYEDGSAPPARPHARRRRT